METMQITLRAARVNAGMSQQEAALHLGVLRDTVSRWEHGKTKPKADQLKALCEFYGIPIENIKI